VAERTGRKVIRPNAELRLIQSRYTLTCVLSGDDADWVRNRAMIQLTYADRELFLETFDALKSTWSESDEALLDQVSKWTKRIVPQFGFEQALTRDVTVLCRYLVKEPKDSPVAEIARAGLVYLLDSERFASSKIAAFGLFDDAYVTSYAVHEIRARLGEKAQYTPPRLSPSECRRAEDLFLSFHEQPLLPDDALIQKAREVCTDLQGLAESALFSRLRKNIDFLIAVVSDPARTAEHRTCARAGLSYFVCRDDAIGDRLGLVGYLDDNAIAQLAVDLIEPAREPWLELLDATVGAWPFLNAVVLDEEGLGRPVSEFMLINSALGCPDLRGKQEASSTLLVVPHTGPVPFVIGFLSALGLIQDFLRADKSTVSFEKGQRVLVDNGAIRTFAGTRTLNGREEFGLVKSQRLGGQQSFQTRWWPISDLWRLTAADAARSTRGRIVHDLRQSDAPLTALEHLFITAHSPRLHELRKRVMVVTRTPDAHELATRVRLHGYRLCDTVPMGNLSNEGLVKPWSSSFGLQEPVLIFASDLDRACAHAEESLAEVHLFVVDAAGANAARTASLSRLRQLHVPAVVVMGSNVADQLDLSKDRQTAVWEWRADDYNSLLWPDETRQTRRGRITQYERRVRTTHGGRPEVRPVSMPVAGDAFRATKELQALAEARGDNPLVELDELVSLSFRALSRLLRCVVAIPQGSLLAEDIEAILRELERVRSGSLFLSSNESAAAATANDLLRQLFDSISQHNPKVDLLQETLRTHPGLSIIFPDRRGHNVVAERFTPLGTPVFFDATDQSVELTDGSVIPAWFGKATMGKLLAPPISNPLILVFYEVESHWYEGFRRARLRSANERAGQSGRSKLFPGVPGWAKPPDFVTGTETDQSENSLGELEKLQAHARNLYRREAYSDARSDGSESEVPARFVLFEGDAHAFLTDNYRAKVATHLLERSGEDSEAIDLEIVSANRLRPGDALLFHRGSARDVIRQGADRILSTGVRESASLWRIALQDLVKRDSLSIEELWQRLHEAGCIRHLQTVRNWLEDEDQIAPAAERDIQIIANMTGHSALRTQLSGTLQAIGEVRGAHLRASLHLAKQVLARTIEALRSGQSLGPMVEIESEVVLARIVEIDSEPVSVRTSAVNRLREGIKDDG
jgi:uncharacterized membrane protein YkvA (DUF1232 family)